MNQLVIDTIHNNINRHAYNMELKLIFPELSQCAMIENGDGGDTPYRTIFEYLVGDDKIEVRYYKGQLFIESDNVLWAVSVYQVLHAMLVRDNYLLAEHGTKHSKFMDDMNLEFIRRR